MTDNWRIQRCKHQLCIGHETLHTYTKSEDPCYVLGKACYAVGPGYEDLWEILLAMSVLKYPGYWFRVLDRINIRVSICVAVFISFNILAWPSYVGKFVCICCRMGYG